MNQACQSVMPKSKTTLNVFNNLLHNCREKYHKKSDKAWFKKKLLSRIVGKPLPFYFSRFFVLFSKTAQLFLFSIWYLGRAQYYWLPYKSEFLLKLAFLVFTNIQTSILRLQLIKESQFRGLNGLWLNMSLGSTNAKFFKKLPLSEID